MVEIGPGTPLICIDDRMTGTWYDICYERSLLAKGALYICREVHVGPTEECCPWDQCGQAGLKLKDKTAKYCPNLFRPLNDGDTSLVEDEEDREDQEGLGKYIKVMPIVRQRQKDKEKA